MRPENDIKDDLERTVDGSFDIDTQEQTFLTMFRELSETDRSYLSRVAEVMVLAKESSLK